MAQKHYTARFLQWNQSCDSLVRLVNSTAHSKLFLDSQVVSIGNLEYGTAAASVKVPGTVAKIDENVWQVAAADGVVKICDFLDENNKPITAQDLAEQCHIIEGGKLPVLTSEQFKWFEMVYARASSSEPYCRPHLARFQAHLHSCTQNKVPAWAATDYLITSKDTTALEMIVAWLVYINRDTELSQLQIGWDASECLHYHNRASSTTYAFAKTIPYDTFIDVNGTFSDVTVSVEKYYEQLTNHLLCLPDALIRHIFNTTNRDLRAIQLYALGVSLTDKQDENQDSENGTIELSCQAHGSLMTLRVNKQNGAFRWIYDKSQISEEDVNRISSHLLVLLASVKHEDNATKAVAKLNLLPNYERDHLLFGWNQTAVFQTHVCCLHQLFEVQVKSDGYANAVDCEGKYLNYLALNSKANRLAHYLIARNVKPDDRIALCFERSTTMIVAILGILKAGCAYVPLDPVYSSQRLTNILFDADAKFLLTDSTGSVALGDHQVAVINLENFFPANLPIHNPDTNKLELNPTHLAYVIYTSGSTGTPKGVMIEHQHVVQYFEAVHQKFSFIKQNKWCHFHSISFDFSVWEIWGALLQGSQLSIVPYNITSSANEFYEWICSNGINILGQTPSAFKNLLRADEFRTRIDQLLYIFVGGEALDPMIIRDWYEKYNNGKTVLSNSYGPTETTVDATVWIYDIKVSDNSISSIGRSLSNKRVYLLDSCGEPVLLGAEGEIYIGGASIARGYLNRSELTMECFSPDPFSNVPMARMYRTGDLARHLPDGNLVFLGRVDQQVKIRGFRIELGEIEARLVEHPNVNEAVVQTYGRGSDTRLVAYVVANANTSLVHNLRSYLLNLLPNYMVPAAYVLLPSLPLTPNGKLDRRALPAMNDEAYAHQQFEAPLGEVEGKLANIWCELFGIDRISRHDNFFELGGHSLLVMHFVNKAKPHNMNIDARGVFSFPILKDLAEQIDKHSKRLYCDEAVPIRQFGNETPLFLLPDGGGDISYAFELARDIDKNIPVYVLPWLSPDKNQPSSIEEMASTMIPKFKKIRPNGPCGIVGYSSGGILAIEITKQLINSGDSVSFLGLIDTYATIRDPLSETEFLLESLRVMYPNFNIFNDSEWLHNVKKLSLHDAIEEIRKTNLGFNNGDVEWQTLLLKQCYNYQNICAAYKIDSLPMETHLFQASNEDRIFDERKIASCPILSWKTLNISTGFKVISIDGDHLTMMKNSKNRRVLGEKLTESLLCK